ncbi:hypothetical protein FDENT_598 [Fusarium denticulatum]|uniref:Uncharacterized protein n=1 Tax=Fusarium denticulatum TaxID=48507 RepID=A0A8H5XKH8_9HYPO|nr:hypothetical protein FDENT_598 [Fusarium denticulatum]
MQRIMKMRLSFVFLFAFRLSAAVDIFVDRQGHDYNPGSAGKPVKGIKRAQELVRELIASAKDDITVHLGPGTWEIDEPIMFNNEDSGINGFKVTWAGSETAISGGYEISNWTEGDDGIWANQLIGYDQIAEPFWDGGVWIQNVKALLTDGGQFYLDRNESTVYYKPLEGENMATASACLGVEEVLLVVGGTYEEPVHDLHFEGITFKHSTWLRPDTYGGTGVGNDKNAHSTGVGLGANNIDIDDNYFTQAMGNSITVGGIQADAHHPSQPKMPVSDIHASNNIFNNNSVLWSSTVPILFTYTQFSSVTHNDIYNQPYSGICHGYGGGSNDEGGSPEYVKRGLYEYQPLYDTPTVTKNNLIEGNLIHHFGQSHTDFGGVYTLSRSPNTTVSFNFIYDAGWQALYPDEAPRNITSYNNLGFTSGKYYAPNDWIPEQLTGWSTVIDNWGKLGVKDNKVLDGFPNHSGRRNNTFLRNYLAPDINGTSLIAQRAAYRAGVIPSKRKGRSVTNDADIANAYLDVKVSDGRVVVNVTNFDDVLSVSQALVSRSKESLPLAQSRLMVLQQRCILSLAPQRRTPPLKSAM